MARVVRRRKNPLLPVLLIFVFLFLIAAVMATLFYNNGKEDAKRYKQSVADTSKIISKPERKSGEVRSIISETGKPGKSPTVFAELNRRNAVITRKITGAETTVALASAKLDAAIGPDAFVLDVLKTERDAHAAEVATAKGLRTQIANFKASEQDATANFNKADEGFRTKVTTLEEDKRTLTATNAAMVTTHADEMKASDEKWQAKVTQQEQEVDTKTAQVNQLTVQNEKLKILVDTLRRQLRDKKKTTEETLTIREAGRIKEIMPDRDVCFIPLGTQDRVVRGMTFRVYGAEGIPNDGAGHKAALTVVRVFKTVSQCRVSVVRKDDPVAIGDAFANIAFDPAHQPLFVVEGRFDLTGTGRLTDTGTQEVIALIKRSGGKVADKLTVDVDFVVMGPEPSKPSELDENAAGTAKKAWEIRMEEYNRWRKTLDEAIKLNVPKLNTRRFLTLTGYETAREYQD